MKFQSVWHDTYPAKKNKKMNHVPMEAISKTNGFFIHCISFYLHKLQVVISQQKVKSMSSFLTLTLTLVTIFPIYSLDIKFLGISYPIPDKLSDIEFLDISCHSILELDWVIVVQHQFSNFQLYYGENKFPGNFQWNDDEVHFVLDQHTELDFYSASSLKQQSAGRHIDPLGNIILIPSQPVFALSP
jgi:hypothetical protein